MGETIFYGGTILTMDPEHPKAEAVVVRGDKITDTGSFEELSSQYKYAKLHNLNGATMLPGFNDSHCHMLNYGLILTTVNLKDVKSIEEISERVHRFIASSNLKKGEWIFGRGWHETGFMNPKMPAKQDLDSITTDYPINLVRSCGHVISVNSKALEVAGITKDTPDPANGKIYRDENGEPSGILSENAAFLVSKEMPQLDKERIKNLLFIACREARKHGVLTVQSEDFKAAGGYKPVIEAYRELAQEGRLPVKVEEQMYFTTPEEIIEFLENDYKSAFKGYESMLSLGPVKILLDGSLGAKTAYLKEPYAGEGDYRGILIHKPDDLYKLMRAAHNRNIPAACHAIGDGAVQLFLDTVERLQEDHPNKSIRHRVIHCQITDREILKRIAALNVCVDIEPSFVPTDYNIVASRVGEEKARTSYAWKTMLDLGIHIGSGSDAPVEKIDPILGLHAAVTRTDLKGNPKVGWNPEEKLTIEQALYIYTMGSAYVCGKENETGSISKGKKADMLIIDSNPLDIASNRLPNIKVLNTIVNGIMFQD